MKKPGLKPPRPDEVFYLYNHNTGYYHVTSKPRDFDRLPDVLIKTPARNDTIRQFADHVIQSPMINGKREFHSMLERIPKFKDVFSGDDYYMRQSKSLILFFFSESDKAMYIHYFRGFHPETKAGKDRFIKSYLEKFLK